MKLSDLKPAPDSQDGYVCQICMAKLEPEEELERLPAGDPLLINADGPTHNGAVVHKDCADYCRLPESEMFAQDMAENGRAVLRWKARPEELVAVTGRSGSTLHLIGQTGTFDVDLDKNEQWPAGLESVGNALTKPPDRTEIQQLTLDKLDALITGILEPLERGLYADEHGEDEADNARGLVDRLQMLRRQVASDSSRAEVWGPQVAQIFTMLGGKENEGE